MTSHFSRVTAGPKDSPAKCLPDEKCRGFLQKPCRSAFCSQPPCIKRDDRTEPSGTEHFPYPSFPGTKRGKLLKDRRQTVIHSHRVLPPAVNTDELWRRVPPCSSCAQEHADTEKCTTAVLSDSRQPPRESRASRPALQALPEPSSRVQLPWSRAPFPQFVPQWKRESLKDIPNLLISSSVSEARK